MRETGCVLVILIVITACAPELRVRKEETYAPIEASLRHINQKVAGHFVEAGVPDGFDEAQYIAVLEQVCFPDPHCKLQAEGILEGFGIKARNVADMFSIMLCDRDLKWKVMEDFSCNNLRVEIQTWRIEDQVRCEFEADWQRVAQEFCER